MMKQILLIITLAFSLSARASLPAARDAAHFTCVKSDSKTAVQLKYVLEDQENDFDALENVKHIAKNLGYDWLSVDNIVNCSNDNSEGVDFELLRKYTINALFHRYLF